MQRNRRNIGLFLLLLGNILALCLWFSCERKPPVKEEITTTIAPPVADACKNVNVNLIFAQVGLDLIHLPVFNTQTAFGPTWIVWDNAHRLTALHYNGLLASSKITRLPAQLGCAYALTMLTLPYNVLSELPESIGSLPYLQKLDVSNNALTLLPVSFASLSALKELNLEGNAFASFPAALLELQNLESLHFCGPQMNAQMQIPTQITGLKKLTNLCLPKISAQAQTVLRQAFTATHPRLILTFR